MASDPSYPDSEVARLIRNARIRKGMSYARLGAAVDRTATTIRRWERGEITPQEEAFPALAEALDVEQEALLHALHGPDPHVVVAAPAEVTSDEPSDADTSVSGGELGASVVVAEPMPEPTPIRPGIALVPAKEDDTESGEIAVVPDNSSDQQEETPKPWIDVSNEQIVTPSSAKQPTPRPAKEAPPKQVAPVATTATTSSTEPTEPVVAAVVPPPRAVAVIPQTGWRQLPSYAEDPRERWRYVLRFILTAVALAIMAYVTLWAGGELLTALDEAMDLFSDPEDVTATTTVFSTP